MQDIYIKSADVKNFFLKKHKENNIVTKRILGISFEYARGKYYIDFVIFLNYLKPYIKKDINIQALLDEFLHKSKKRYISAKVYLNDINNQYNK